MEKAVDKLHPMWTPILSARFEFSVQRVPNKPHFVVETELKYHLYVRTAANGITPRPPMIDALLVLAVFAPLGVSFTVAGKYKNLLLPRAIDPAGASFICW